MGMGCRFVLARLCGIGFALSFVACGGAAKPGSSTLPPATDSAAQKGGDPPTSQGAPSADGQAAPNKATGRTARTIDDGALAVGEPAPAPAGSSTGPDALLARRCEADEGRACFLRGLLFEQGVGVAADFAVAAGLYARACTIGVAQGCYNLAVFHDKGRGVLGNPRAAVALYEKACELGEPGGCSNLGLSHELGKGVPADAARARALYESACTQGSMLGCSNLAAMHREGAAGLAKDREKARELYLRACYGGHRQACLRAVWIRACDPSFEGWCAQETTGGLLVVDWLEAPCKRGDMVSCAGKGLYLESGLEVEVDLPRAIKEYDRACKRNEPLACNNLGHLHRQGKGVKANVLRAMQLLGKACVGGFVQACRDLGALHVNGGARPKSDVAQGLGLMRRACDARLSEACIELELLCLSGQKGACAEAPPQKVR